MQSKPFRSVDSVIRSTKISTTNNLLDQTKDDKKMLHTPTEACVLLHTGKQAAGRVSIFPSLRKVVFTLPVLAGWCVFSRTKIGTPDGGERDREVTPPPQDLLFSHQPSAVEICHDSH